MVRILPPLLRLSKKGKKQRREASSLFLAQFSGGRFIGLQAWLTAGFESFVCSCPTFEKPHIKLNIIFQN